MSTDAAETPNLFSDTVMTERPPVTDFSKRLEARHRCLRCRLYGYGCTAGCDGSIWTRALSHLATYGRSATLRRMIDGRRPTRLDTGRLNWRMHDARELHQRLSLSNSMANDTITALSSLLPRAVRCLRPDGHVTPAAVITAFEKRDSCITADIMDEYWKVRSDSRLHQPVRVPKDVPLVMASYNDGHAIESGTHRDQDDYAAPCVQSLAHESFARDMASACRPITDFTRAKYSKRCTQCAVSRSICTTACDGSTWPRLLNALAFRSSSKTLRSSFRAIKFIRFPKGNGDESDRARAQRALDQVLKIALTAEREVAERGDSSTAPEILRALETVDSRVSSPLMATYQSLRDAETGRREPVRAQNKLAGCLLHDAVGRGCSDDCAMRDDSVWSCLTSALVKTMNGTFRKHCVAKEVIKALRGFRSSPLRSLAPKTTAELLAMEEHFRLADSVVERACAIITDQQGSMRPHQPNVANAIWAMEDPVGLTTPHCLDWYMLEETPGIKESFRERVARFEAVEDASDDGSRVEIDEGDAMEISGQ